MQLHIKSLVDGLELPLGQGNLQAFITPPNPGDSLDPVVYIWGSRGEERRHSMPRAQPGRFSTGAFKLITHHVDLWLVWCGYSDDEMSDSAFPAVMEAVMAVLRNTQLQVLNVIDPVTGGTSNIEAIGEDIDYEYAPVQSLQAQQMLRYLARLTLKIVEKIQA